MSLSALQGIDVKKQIKNWLRPRVISVLSEVAARPDSQAGTTALAADPFTEVRLRYLLDEVSDLRIAVRELTSPKAGSHAVQDQTKESFSYQWGEIKEGAHLLGDSAFEATMLELLSKYTDYPKSWFPGKKVLDAGCGMGRWSYGFIKLGAVVTAVDQSASGVGHLNKLLATEPNFKAQQADLLNPLPFGRDFDLVWCYGVTHHTGNTRLATQNVAACVKPGGRIMLMIYGEPVKLHEFTEINTYVEHRRATENMSFEDKVKYLEARYPKQLVHGFFDAISPKINDLHRFDEIETWLRALGFVNVRRTLDNRNIHLVADRPKS